MNRSNFENALKVISSFNNVKCESTFLKVLLINEAKINLELSELEKKAEPSEKFKEYENKRIELCIKHSKRDSSGKSIVRDGNFIMKDQKLFDTDLVKLKEPYKKDISLQEEKVKNLQVFLTSESGIKFKTISSEDCPDMTLTQMRHLVEFIS